MISSIFISKNSGELVDLQHYCNQNNIQLTAKSFLEFKPQFFLAEKDFDIIFFSSPRSVLFYKANHSIPKSVKVACTGQKTASVLKQIGCNVDFVGESSDMTSVANSFKGWCGDRTVLFPISNISKKSISKVLPEQQVEEVVCYNTDLVKFEVAEHNVYVFTSPSNVEAFFSAGNSTKKDHVIAWGSTTEKALKNHDVKPIVLNQPSISELIHTLSTLS